MTTFDAIIIGSGQGGTPLSKKLAMAGWKTALVEKEFIGGTCINRGCTPTKTMIASAKAAYTIANAGALGIETGGYSINLEAVLERKRKVVENFRNGSREGLEQTENLTLIFGTASFIDVKKLQVELNDGTVEIITAGKIFINTGDRPSVPKVAGLDGIPYLDSTSIMELTEIPSHLLIIGGGYVGLEFGQMFKRFGSKVTILEHGKRLLPREDEDIAAVVADFLNQEDIRIVTDAQATKAEKHSNGLHVTVKTGGKEELINCSHVLIAAGRTPNTEKLNLAVTKVEMNERGQVKVNENLETSAEGIYAIGDVKGGPEFTHISYNDYIILANNLLDNKNQTTVNRMVPYCMFTDPQLGRVGITETEAREKGLNIKVAKLPMTKVARAVETGDTRGILKAIIDAQSDEILGAAVVGEEGGEIMSILQMAMVGRVTYKYIADMIFAHPLYAESLNNLFLSLN